MVDNDDVKVVRLFKNDLFGGPPPFQPDKVKKAAKHDKLIDSYMVHLESLLTPGAYSDFLDATEIKRMADIRSCINVSTHPKVKQIEDLYNKVVVRLKSTWNYAQVDKWFKLSLMRWRGGNLSIISMRSHAPPTNGQTATVKANKSHRY